MAAKVNSLDPKGGPAQLREGDRGFVRFDGQGYLEVAPDPRLDMTKHCTVEAWVRNPSGSIANKMQVWQWGFLFVARPDGLDMEGLRSSYNGAPLRSAYAFPKDTWTHVAAVFDVNGHLLLYADGKLIGETKLNVLIIEE